MEPRTSMQYETTRSNHILRAHKNKKVKLRHSKDDETTKCRSLLLDDANYLAIDSRQFGKVRKDGSAFFHIDTISLVIMPGA